MIYRIFDKATGKEIDYTKYGLTNFGDVICYKNQLVMLNKSDFIIMSGHDIKKDFNSKEYQLQLLQNYETQIMDEEERKTIANIWVVKQLLTQFTSQGGSTSAYKHCDFLGIDPDGYSFH